MVDPRYRLLLENLPDGFAYHELLVDANGKPIDYVFLEVNSAFERLTGLARKDIIGKRVTQVLPGIERSSFDWIGTYGQVALSGVTKRFEAFAEPLKRWYEVTAYSDRKGFFATVFRDITEWKVMQKALQFERNQLLSIFDSLEEIVYVSDPYTYEILYVNRYTQRMFGKPLVGGLCYREFQGRDAPCPFCTNALILEKKGEPYQWEYHNPILNRHYLITDRIIRWPDGREVRFEIAIDITAQKEAQNQLRESEERWRTTLGSLGEGVVVADLQGRVTYLNPAAEALTGWPLEEAQGKPLEEVFVILNARTRRRATGVVQRVLRSGKAKKLANDTLLLARDGTERYLADSASPLRDAEGNVRGVVVVFQDVTEEYRLRKEIEERERRYHAILSAVQDIVFTLDTEERHTGVYGQWLDRYRLSPEVFLGKTARDLFGEEAALVHHRANQRALQGEPVVYEWSTVRDGETLYFQTSLSPIRDEHGAVREVVGIGREITDLKRAEVLRQKLLDGFPYPVCLVNRERRIMAQNRAAEMAAGSKVGDLCWFSFHGTEMLPEEQRRQFEETGVLPPGARCAFCRGDEALDAQRTIVEEVTIKGRVYETGWVPLERDVYLHYTIDITRYKEMEQALRRERDRAEKYLDTAEVIFLILNPLGEVVLVNRKGAEVLGYTREELVGKRWFECCVPESERKALQDAFARVVSGEADPAGCTEYPVVTREGNKRLIAWRNTLLRDEEGAIEGLLSVGTDITESRAMEEEIRYLTFHDALTGVYNRLFLERELEKLDTPENLPMGVLMVDVNGLKLVNDTYGHSSGDELLRAVADVLRRSCRKEDLIVRFGGDEFLVLLPRTSPEESQKICQRIRRNAQDVYIHDVPLSLALGLATRERDGENLMVVLRRAEDEMYREKLAETRSSRSAIISALLKALEAKSYETEVHTRRMEEVGLAIATRLGLPESEKHRLKIAIMLHDIGKITLPEELLRKPGPLTPEEWALIKTHPEFGYRIVRATPEFAHVAEEVWSHHERWDGTGYPRGLRGEEIPLLARIIALADAYEVMRYGRPYKQALSEECIVAELKRCAGTQFDPQLVAIFLSILEEKNRG